MTLKTKNCCGVSLLLSRASSGNVGVKGTKGSQEIEPGGVSGNQSYPAVVGCFRGT